MKTKDKSALRSATDKELEKQISDLESGLAALLVNRYTKASKNLRESKTIHYKIAVIKTILNERENLNEQK